MPYLKTGDLEIEYASAGSGSDVLVLVHGNFGSWRWWSSMLQRLPRGVTAYAPVLRGCGGTRGDDGDFTIPRLARDLRAFVDTLGVRRFHLVGHSLGGAVAMEFALSSPRRLKSLMLVAPAPAEGLAGIREGDSQLARMLRLIDPDHNPSLAMLYGAHAVSRLTGVDRFNIRVAMREVAPSLPANAPELDLLVRDAAQMTSEAFIGYLRALHYFDIAARLSDLRRPAIVLAGARDRTIPLSALVRLAELLPRGKLVTWSDVGHAPQLERPEAFARLLTVFVRRHAWPFGALAFWDRILAGGETVAQWLAKFSLRLRRSARNGAS